MYVRRLLVLVDVRGVLDVFGPAEHNPVGVATPLVRDEPYGRRGAHGRSTASADRRSFSQCDW